MPANWITLSRLIALAQTYVLQWAFHAALKASAEAGRESREASRPQQFDTYPDIDLWYRFEANTSGHSTRGFPTIRWAPATCSA